MSGGGHGDEVRFCLGTADIGMGYGIASTKKVPTAEEAKEIIQLCQKLGVRHGFVACVI